MAGYFCSEADEALLVLGEGTQRKTAADKRLGGGDTVKRGGAAQIGQRARKGIKHCCGSDRLCCVQTKTNGEFKRVAGNGTDSGCIERLVLRYVAAVLGEGKVSTGKNAGDGSGGRRRGR